MIYKIGIILLVGFLFACSKSNTTESAGPIPGELLGSYESPTGSAEIFPDSISASVIGIAVEMKVDLYKNDSVYGTVQALGVKRPQAWELKSKGDSITVGNSTFAR
jgi:hypothetical protein